MSRLTIKEPSGKWFIRGVDFQSLPPTVYGALCKLLDYEETGLDPDEVDRMKDASEQIHVGSKIHGMRSTVSIKKRASPTTDTPRDMLSGTSTATNTVSGAGATSQMSRKQKGSSCSLPFRITGNCTSGRTAPSTSRRSRRVTSRSWMIAQSIWFL